MNFIKRPLSEAEKVSRTIHDKRHRRVVRACERVAWALRSISRTAESALYHVEGMKKLLLLGIAEQYKDTLTEEERVFHERYVYRKINQQIIDEQKHHEWKERYVAADAHKRGNAHFDERTGNMIVDWKAEEAWEKANRTSESGQG